jgi:cytoskeletal protein RodZ
MFERNRIAETLRNAREKQGLSLEQAAASASIPLQYVRLLEGETNVRIGVSDELYLIPFFRKYARFVGLDAEELLPEFLGVVQQMPGDPAAPIRLSYRPRLSFLWRPALVLATIAIAVLLMLRQNPSRQGIDEPGTVGDETAEPRAAVPDVAAAVSPASDAVAPTPLAVVAAAAAETVGAAGPTALPPTPAPRATAQPTAAAPIAAAPAAAASPEPSGAHQLAIAAIEETWFSLAVDGQPAKQYILKAGESRAWPGEVFTLTVGNAGGIAVTVDGRELPPLGPKGKVVRNLRLPAPSPTATTLP